MSRKEKTQTIVKIVISLIILAVIRSLTCTFTFLPSLVFWLIAEIFLFADGYAVYSMFQGGQA